MTSDERGKVVAEWAQVPSEMVRHGWRLDFHDGTFSEWRFDERSDAYIGAMAVSGYGFQFATFVHPSLADRLAASGGESPFTEAHGVALRELRVGEVLTAEAWEAVCAFIREGEAVLDARGERIRELEEASPPPAAEQGSVLVGPIEREDGREYIPLPGGWEVHTKGRGSSFRIVDGKTGDRLAVPESPYLHDTITNMAREIHGACVGVAHPPAAALGEVVTDAMVEAALKEWRFRNSPSAVARASDMRAALLAALGRGEGT